MDPEMVYLDYNATAPVRPEAAAAVAAALAIGGNPSSVHRPGREARKLVEAGRAEVAALCNAEAAEVIFTSGGTEAIGLALAGAGARRLLVGAVEHDAVMNAAAAMDPERIVLPVDGEGRVDLDGLARALAAAPSPALVAVMLANNETGVVQPVREVSEIARTAGARVLCDAVQAAGRMPVDIAGLGVDYMALSGHKLGGPQGVGALIVREGAPFAPPVPGGGQEYGRRSGTENVPGIAGFAAAARAAGAGLADRGRIAALRDGMERRLAAAVPAVRFWGAGAERLGNTSCIGMPGVAAETQVMALDLAGVAVSAGAACSSGKVKASRVLAAMGASPEDAASGIRVSLGWRTSEADIDRLVAAWTQLYAHVAARRETRQPAA